MPVNPQGEEYEVREKNGLIYHFYPSRKGKNQWVYIRWNDENLRAAGLQVPDQAPAAPPPAPKPIEPFFSADDLSSLAQFTQSFETQMADLDRAFGDLKVQTTYEKTNVDREAKQGTASATDQMIARGLFQSSIKDAALIDIEAQRQLQQKFLDDRLVTAELDTSRKKKILQDGKTGFENALNLKAVENAAQVSAAQAPPPAPAGEAPPQGSGPNANTSDPNYYVGKVKNGKFYHYYPNRKDGNQWVYIRPASGGG